MYFRNLVVLALFKLISQVSAMKPEGTESRTDSGDGSVSAAHQGGDSDSGKMTATFSKKSVEKAGESGSTESGDTESAERDESSSGDSESKTKKKEDSSDDVDSSKGKKRADDSEETSSG